MMRVLGILQWSAGFALGLLPAAGPRLASAAPLGVANLPAISLATASALIPAVASLYSWDRHPYLVGGIISGIVVVAGPLNPLLTACAPLLSW